MWLLDTSSLVLSAFSDDIIPYYVILSHTWGKEEVSFKDIQGPHERVLNRDGYKKIKRCCAQALEAGFRFVWIDTCCIDQTNSAELSEAINSMFRWYENAVTCYAYLEDVKPSTPQKFFTSRWFTRGWTLQELIAPTDVLFFDCFWNEIGSRATLAKNIEEITRIPSKVLMNSSLRDHCIAEIMSWAAGRKTTRIEDRAYSLMGLFGASMPLIYGEGENAFLRLQLEIMKTTTDHTLFAWYASSDEKREVEERGPLARSADEFAKSGSIRSLSVLEDSSFEMTNLGLRITLPCISEPTEKDTGRRLFACLNCKFEAHEAVLGIWLKEATTREGKPMGRFYRSHLTLLPEHRGPWAKEPKPTLLHIIQPDFRSSINPEGFLDSSLLSCCVDYSALFEAGYRLESDSVLGASIRRSEEFKMTIELCSTPWVILFTHMNQSTRFWVALCGLGGRFWSMIEHRVDDEDTLDSLWKDTPPSLRITSRLNDIKGACDNIVKRLYTGEGVKVTAKRAMVSGKVGFMVRLAMFKETKDVYTTPPPQHQHIPARYRPTSSPDSPPPIPDEERLVDDVNLWNIAAAYEDEIL